MLQCPVCRQSCDSSVQIFVPPHPEIFDTVACAERAVEVLGWQGDARAPIIEIVDPGAYVRGSPARRRGPAPAAYHRVLGQRALLAAGVSLFFAGAAASMYLWASGAGKSQHALATDPGVPSTPLTTNRSPDAARHLAAPSTPPTTSRPSDATRRRETSPARTRPETKAARPPEKTLHSEQPLAAGRNYQARAFPLAIRITPPDGTWAGAQWTTGSSHGRPAFGWVALGQLPVDDPRGVVSIETAFGPTPSSATIVARLRSAGEAAVYGKTTRVSLAGFHGWQTDGRIVGRFGHVFVPFSPRNAGATPPDSYRLDSGESFRLIVLDVRGTRVVLFLESIKLPPKEFRAFLATAGRMLESLDFPG